jgi:hypothetical protein
MHAMTETASDARVAQVAREPRDADPANPRARSISRITCYDTGHVSSTTVCDAFASGIVGSPGVMICHLCNEDGRRTAADLEAAADPRCDGFVYGKKRGTLDIVRALARAGCNWLYADNGYLRPSRHSDGAYSGFYKVTLNAFQLSGAAASPPVSPGDPEGEARFRALNIEVSPWRRGGNHIVVCPPIEEYCSLMGFDGAAWLARVRDTLAAHTDRPVMIRRRPRPDAPSVAQRPLADDLGDAWALVTHDSNVVVEATVLGVPCFVTGPGPAEWLGNVDLARIEDPVRDRDRRRWLAHLAANQWTLAEMRDGTCWKHLRRIHSL